MSETFRVLVTDGVSSRGVEVLKQLPQFEVVECKSMSEAELLERIVDVDALVVRSQTKVTAKVFEKSNRLKVVGRAGVGVDNVDVDSATSKGVVVMNTPAGNTISTAEHTFSLLLSLARNIPQAHASMKEGKWERQKFQGIELNNKVLGIVGMGRIGSEVARRAFAFGMRVMVYDPYLSHSKARSLQVELFDVLEEMLPHCDFITLHIPMTAETKGILNTERLAKCKKGVRLVNCARGGLIEETALEQALLSGHVGAAALDVYEQEPPPADMPLRNIPQVVFTPHLGASTFEAQESVGVEIAEAIRDMLLQGVIRNAVNMPNVDMKVLNALRPYFNLADKLGRLMAQMTPSRCDQLTVNYCGKISEQDTTSLTRAVLKGFLSQAGGSAVNEVNAPKYAENLGIKFSEVKTSELQNYSELIAVSVRSGDKDYQVSGTLFGKNARIVNLNGYDLEASPEGVILAFENKDRPGVVGWIGSLMGTHQINIASMSLGRSGPGTRALCLLNLDSMPPEAVMEELRKEKDIFWVQAVQL